MICLAIKIKREEDMGPQQKKERDSHRSRNKSGDPNKFIAEAIMNLVYIAKDKESFLVLYNLRIGCTRLAI